MKNQSKFFLFIISLCILTLGSDVTSTARSRKFVTYEQFGAYGDGVHDDLPAIVDAHAAANERNLPVRANGKKTYYIGSNKLTAVIKTDVDWGKAHFIIDDRAYKKSKQPIFKVEPSGETVPIRGLVSVSKGQKNLGVKFPGRCMVELADSNHKIYIREGVNFNDGTPQREVIIVDADGNVDERTPIVWDYPQVTEALMYAHEEKQLVIKGGIFTTRANQTPTTYRNYFARNIAVNRSNVLIEGLTHYVTDELDHGSPYSAFLSISHACDVTVSDCLMTGRKAYSTRGASGGHVTMGSYDLSATMCVNVMFRNVHQTNDFDDNTWWGVFTSNLCKDLKMDGCEVSRYDAHMGVTNVTLTNCRFGYMGIRMVGFGTIRVENCEIRSGSLVQLRGDYGSSWEGDIIVRNSVLHPVNPSTGSVTLLSGSNSGKHDFGYQCRLPYSMTFENLVIDDSAITNKAYAGPSIFAHFKHPANDPDLLPYPAEGKVILRNVTVKSGKELTLSPNPDLFAAYDIQVF